MKIREWTQQSLRTRLSKSLSHDWIPERSAHKFPLRQYYVQLKWKKNVRTAMGSETITLTSLHDLLKLKQSRPSNFITQEAGANDQCHTSSVIVEGEGGIGKTSSLGMLALDWAEDARPELQKFQFVFLILLRYVEGNEPLEEIIMQQHGRLETENVSPSEVKAILQGETKNNILLIFDGYDEYSEGCNESIDKLLKNGKDNCTIIVSSRSGDFLHPIKSSMDEEVRITGFSEENIVKCAEQYLGSEQSCHFLSQAEKAGIYKQHRLEGFEPIDLTPIYHANDWSLAQELLHVPIILLMACAVYIENKCLPSNKTTIFKQVVHMCISRTTLKTMGKTASEVENLRELLLKLGKLAWQALIRKSKKLLLYKKDVIAESGEILELGLLFGENVDATTTDLPDVLSFQHKLIQEYIAAVYIAENINKGTFLDETFPTLDMIQTQREVVQFACGILATTDASPLTNHVAKVLGEYISNQINTEGHLPSANFPFLSSLQKEGDVSLINPYLNEYPACGRPLAQVLASTKLVYITGIDQNDPLQLNPCPDPARIVVKLSGERRTLSSERYDRLWQALGSVPTIVIALSLHKLDSAKEMKLGEFSQLKYLYLDPVDMVGMSDLREFALSIGSRAPQPPLIFCQLSAFTSYTSESDHKTSLPRSLLKALSGCNHLKYLTLSQCDLHDMLSILMVSPPPSLRVLKLCSCNLHAGDIYHLTQSFSNNKLTKLRELNLCFNPIGEAALSMLLQVINIKPHTLKELNLWKTGVYEIGSLTDLSWQFVNEWKKGKRKNIPVIWGMDDWIK